MKRIRVAILGAGIMGSSLALLLARNGAEVTLFDRCDQPMAATSRWNEGKIHLGYLYSADPTLGTVRHLLPGGLAFAPLLSRLIDADLAEHSTTSDDIYLVHHDSVVDPASMTARFAAIDELVRAHPDATRYLTDVSDARTTRVTADELDAIAGDGIVAGFRVPERSIDTRWAADQIAGAIAADGRVHFRGGETVVGAAPVNAESGTWQVRCPDGAEETFDVVVNALWNGRLPVDLDAGLDPERPWSHRYRLCVFVRTGSVVEIPSAIVAVGPFGDVKNYNGRDFYVSWYPAGLIAEGEGLELGEPRPLDAAGRERFIGSVRAGLEPLIPGVGRVFDEAEQTLVAGGFVFARGTGSIGDRASSLHLRDRFGVRRRGAYYSVDTGKYSTAPWLAERLARELTE